MAKRLFIIMVYLQIKIKMYSYTIIHLGYTKEYLQATYRSIKFNKHGFQTPSISDSQAYRVPDSLAP